MSSVCLKDDCMNESLGRKKMRECSIAIPNQGIQNDTASELCTVEDRKLPIDSDLILANSSAPQLSTHAAVMQELRCTFSHHLHVPPTASANFGETAIRESNNGSTNTTIVVDIHDDNTSGATAFLERGSGIETGVSDSTASHLLHQPSSNCVLTYGQSSGGVTEANVHMNAVQKNGVTSTGSGYTSYHESNHGEPAADLESPHNCVPFATNGKQALAGHNSEPSNARAIGYPSPQPLPRECIMGVDHGDHKEHTSGDNASHSRSHGYINISTRSSLSEPLVEDNHNDCDALCGNHAQLQPSCEVSPDTDCKHTNIAQSSLPLLKRQASAPADMIQPGQFLPTCDSSQCIANDNGCTCVDISQCLHGHNNPVTTGLFNPLLLPPRTIRRANFNNNPSSGNVKCGASVRALPPRVHYRSKTKFDHNPSSDNHKYDASVRTLPPRACRRSKTFTQYSHSLQGSIYEKGPPLLDTGLPDKSEQPAKVEKIDLLSCNNDSSIQLNDEERRRGQLCTDDYEQTADDFVSFSSGKGDSDGDASFLTDKLESLEMSESGESLDTWPPVIPERTELMFIVAHEDPKMQKNICYHDQYIDSDTSIKMTTNRSYVKHS